MKIIGNIPFPIKDRKNKNGIVTGRNGGYIYVRPMWCKWETELYDCELRLLSK